MIRLTIVPGFVAVMGLSFMLLGLTDSSIAQTEVTKTHSGVIRSINLKSRTLKVETLAAVLAISVPTDVEIIVKDKTIAKPDLDNLMVGDKVEVKYTIDDGDYIAHRIVVLGME